MKTQAQGTYLLCVLGRRGSASQVFVIVNSEMHGLLARQLVSFEKYKYGCHFVRKPAAKKEYFLKN